MRIKQSIQEPWFQRIDLICALVAGSIWWFQDKAVAWPALIALIPWLIRLAVGVFPFQRTELDPFLFLFLLTAGVGIWVTYNRETAWMKFYVLAGAIWLYFALARQPRQNLYFSASLIAWCGAAISLIYLLGQDWGTQPADLAFINQIGDWWTNFRPNIRTQAIHSNLAGGILALLLPYSLTSGLIAWRGGKNKQPEWGGVGSAVLTSGLIMVGLFMSSSRAAWIAFGMACATWLACRIYGVAKSGQDRTLSGLIVLALLLVSALVTYVISKYPWEIVGLVDRLPGYSSGASRFELFRNTTHLIGDFAYSGGGLGAFPGLYSQYVMVIPHFLFDYSHNLYLDVALEQGIFGLLAILMILLGSIFYLRLAQNQREYSVIVHWLKQATWVGLAVMVYHGLFDDPLYGMRGTPLLFLIPGMSVALSGACVIDSNKKTSLRAYNPFGRKSHRLLWLITLFVLAFSGGIFLSKRDFRAVWLANLGAISMAQAQLADFPSGKWEISTNVAQLEASQQLFQRALAFDLTERTANYRLGLIAMLQRDYSTAAMYLESAYRENLFSRGIMKVLGFCYTWLGDYDRALVLLEKIPEAEEELEVYAWWWQSQGLNDLSLKAQTMSTLLEAK